MACSRLLAVRVVVLAVDDQDVVIAQAAQLDCRADSAETGPDDDDIELLLTHKH